MHAVFSSVRPACPTTPSSRTIFRSCTSTVGGPAAADRPPNGAFIDILKSRADVGAIVHTHSPMATSLACTGRAIPAFHYMVAVAGGHDIRCAPYFTFGTQELCDAALAALEGRKACLLANHGVIALGADLPAALALAGE